MRLKARIFAKILPVVDFYVLSFTDAGVLSGGRQSRWGNPRERTLICELGPDDAAEYVLNTSRICR